MKIVGVTYYHDEIKEIYITTDGENRLKFVPKRSLLQTIRNILKFRNK